MLVRWRMGLSLTQHLKAKLHNKAQPLTCFYLPFSSVGSAMLACVSCGQSNKLRGGGWGKRENVCVVAYVESTCLPHNKFLANIFDECQRLFPSDTLNTGPLCTGVELCRHQDHCSTDYNFCMLTSFQSRNSRFTRPHPKS